jgi:hypothetical protein
MTTYRRQEGAGLFIVSPTLDKVLVIEDGDYLNIPRGSREHNEPLVKTALREAWRDCGIQVNESDFLTPDTYKVGDLVTFVVMSGKKPNSRKEMMYVPWRTLEENCPDFLYPAVQWAKEKSYG